MYAALETTLTHNRVDLSAIALNVTVTPPTGPPLLLLHGIGSRWTSWWPVIDDLSPQFQLFMPDWRGHGDSQKPDGGYDFADYRDDLLDLIRSLDLQRPRVIGHSLGGIVTMAALAHDPSLFQRAVLEDAPLQTAAGVGPQLDEWLLLSELPVDEAARHYRHAHPEWSEDDCQRRARSITSTHSGVFRDAKASALRNGPIDWLAPLTGIPTPLLLIHGDTDHGSVVVPRDVERFRSVIPGGEAVSIPGGNHFLHRDHRSRFLDVALPFLTRN